MVKIDLSGNSAWQSKSGDKSQSLQDGDYDYKEITLRPGLINIEWVEAGLIVQVLEGKVDLKQDSKLLEYEKGQIIYLNEENIKNLEMVITEDLKLALFSKKANN